MPNPLHSDGLVDYEETQDHQNPTTTRAEVDETVYVLMSLCDRMESAQAMGFG